MTHKGGDQVTATEKDSCRTGGPDPHPCCSPPCNPLGFLSALFGLVCNYKHFCVRFLPVGGARQRRKRKEEDLCGRGFQRQAARSAPLLAGTALSLGVNEAQWPHLPPPGRLKAQTEAKPGPEGSGQSPFLEEEGWYSQLRAHEEASCLDLSLRLGTRALRPG